MDTPKEEPVVESKVDPAVINRQRQVIQQLNNELTKTKLRLLETEKKVDGLWSSKALATLKKHNDTLLSDLEELRPVALARAKCIEEQKVSIEDLRARLEQKELANEAYKTELDRTRDELASALGAQNLLRGKIRDQEEVDARLSATRQTLYRLVNTLRNSASVPSTLWEEPHFAAAMSDAHVLLD